MRFKKGDKVIFKRLPNEWYNEHGIGMPSTQLREGKVYTIAYGLKNNNGYISYSVPDDGDAFNCYLSVYENELLPFKLKVNHLPDWL